MSPTDSVYLLDQGSGKSDNSRRDSGSNVRSGPFPNTFPGRIHNPRNEPVLARYRCTDNRARVISCVGTVTNGSKMTFATVGTQTFTVQARDSAGRWSSKSVAYVVAYNVCLIGEPGPVRYGTQTIPITLQLCDASEKNTSAGSILVEAVSIDGTQLAAAGGSGQDTLFRFDPHLGGTGGYSYSLKTAHLGSGRHTFYFTVVGDPTSHAIEFEIARR